MGVRKRTHGKDSTSLSSHLQKKGSNAKKKFKLESSHIVYVIVGVCVGAFATSIYDNWWRSRQVFTPFSAALDEKVTKNERFWGTYRPQVYMGMKTKSPKSLVTGLMWLKQNDRYSELPLRHTCEQGDKILRYGWVAHDGVNFGMQDIVERGYVLRTEFVKQPGGDHGGDWTWRISGMQSGNEAVTLSVFFYAATDVQGEIIPITEEEAFGKKLVSIQGETEELGRFKIKFPKENNGKSCRYHTVKCGAEGLHKIKDSALRYIKAFKEGSKGKEKFLYFLNDSPNNANLPNIKSSVVFYQVTVDLPFEIDIVFESESKTDRRKMLSGNVFTQKLADWKNKFDKKFESRFPLRNKGYNDDEVNFAKAALSNMIGGIGHFYGQSLVQSDYQKVPVHYWSAHLLTAVPSRSFFPRGFLWDEGFHELLISKWDRFLSEEIISSWFGLLNAEGWIPREQILGDEARSKVPAEFVVQRNKNANPPTLFLAVESIIKSFDQEKITDRDREFLQKIYPKLKAWYNWFNTTQLGSLPFSYRWRGRNANTDAELNPKTLTSGLDDFPRSSHPSDDERHVDLRCWMALASGTMERIANFVHPGNSHEIDPFKQTHQLLTDTKLLNDLHWSPELGIFSDYGNHTDRVNLVRKTFQPSQPGQRPQTRTVRVARQKPRPQFVNAFGYVSLFPFLLQVLKPDSQQLNQILQDLKAEDILWTDYGLRSLSKRDPLYMKRNTEHDPPYWRGQIWININFLAVRALKYYSQQPGPYAASAGELYTSLRTNIVKNMYRQYMQTGYLWENYDDSTGKGKGCHPFTGWSALVVLIMSEQY